MFLDSLKPAVFLFLAGIALVVFFGLIDNKPRVQVEEARAWNFVFYEKVVILLSFLLFCAGVLMTVKALSTR